MSPTIARYYHLLSVAADAQDWDRCDSIARIIAVLTRRYALANQ